MLPASVFGEDGFPAAALELLDSEEFKDRVQGEQELVGWAQGKGEAALKRLIAETDAATEPEVRLRLRDVLKEVVISTHLLKEGQGYVGIQMNEINVAPPGKDEQRGGIWVTWIHPETPAMKAGLQVNDVIIGLNDIKWPAGIGARESFATEIRRLKLGDKVKLEVIRGEGVQEIEMTLAARPLSAEPLARLALMRGGMEKVTPEEVARLEREARDAFFHQWQAARRAGATKP
ncbi:PDZ domain-containing protein [Luteolibacter flavescens]|uniref:PDZ domain-containing protein n=1 Tax=Luteolibacter flavescens TaxID=1859460 RepID=A0ABT3FMV2_9BACT|nr:PDZ domain-containing protein [Luteolibacter flavescens]MCW1884900.1 PDZ domain-containing protein [Luteolibacter flavescens]